MKYWSLIGLLILSPQSAFALQLVGNASVPEGKFRANVGANYLAGLISPPPSFTHVTGVNKALQYEEYIGITYGLGNFLLADTEVGIRGTLFQSDEETVNGAPVHADDQGGYVTLRVAGNLLHARSWILGLWLQSDIPISLETEKFVKPSINYFGGGLNTAFEAANFLVLSQSLFAGSGLGDDKNPNLQSNTIGTLNLGRWLWDQDLLIGTGLSIEADLKSRQDAAYAASPLGNGEIQNMVFITPITLTLPMDDWGLSATYAFKWAGQSVRGDQFANLEVSYSF